MSVALGTLRATSVSLSYEVFRRKPSSYDCFSNKVINLFTAMATVMFAC